MFYVFIGTECFSIWLLSVFPCHNRCLHPFTISIIVSAILSFYNIMITHYEAWFTISSCPYVAQMLIYCNFSHMVVEKMARPQWSTFWQLEAFYCFGRPGKWGESEHSPRNSFHFQSGGEEDDSGCGAWEIRCPVLFHFPKGEGCLFPSSGIMAGHPVYESTTSHFNLLYRLWVQPGRTSWTKKRHGYELLLCPCVFQFLDAVLHKDGKSYLANHVLLLLPMHRKRP